MAAWTSGGLTNTASTVDLFAGWDMPMNTDPRGDIAFWDGLSKRTVSEPSGPPAGWRGGRLRDPLLGPCFGGQRLGIRIRLDPRTVLVCVRLGELGPEEED